MEFEVILSESEKRDMRRSRGDTMDLADYYRWRSYRFRQHASGNPFRESADMMLWVSYDYRVDASNAEAA